MGEQNGKLRALEAALFIYGDPMPFKKIQKLLGLQADEVSALVRELQSSLEGRGLSLLVHDDAAQIATHPDFSEMLQAIVKEELSEDLTPAALETLAIVAYAGPLSRARIDYIRGVNSSYILRNLLIRGLIDRAPDPARANAFHYRASFDFLRHLGASEQSKLPEFERYHKLVFDAETKLDVSLATPSAEHAQAEELKQKKDESR